MDYNEIGKMWRDEESEYPYFYFKEPFAYWYGIDFAKKEDKMEKELEFEHTYICLQVLMQKGACDEGVLWYSKKYIKDGNITPSLENLYKEVPKEEWRNWLLEKFSEHIKVKAKYCCDEFKKEVTARYDSLDNYALVNKRGLTWEIATITKHGTPSCSFTISHCPFCGKKLEV